MNQSEIILKYKEQQGLSYNGFAQAVNYVVTPQAINNVVKGLHKFNPDTIAKLLLNEHDWVCEMAREMISLKSQEPN